MLPGISGGAGGLSTSSSASAKGANDFGGHVITFGNADSSTGGGNTVLYALIGAAALVAIVFLKKRK